MELDFLIVGAIANPTLSPLELDASNSETRAASRVQGDPAGDFQTAEHAKYRYMRWGNRSADVASIASSDPTKFCICMEYIKNRTGMGDINKFKPDEYFAKYGYSRISDPQLGAIAFTVDHIAYVEAVEADGTPIITDSNSGGTDSGYGCSNVRTATPKPEYLTNPRASFWAKN